MNVSTQTSRSNPAQGNAMRFTLAMLMWLKPAGVTPLATFRERAAPLFAEYDLRVERQLRITGKGQIVGQNLTEQPDLIQLVSFPSVEQFKAYVSDPRYSELAKQRDEGIRRMAVLSGFPLDIDRLSTPGIGPVNSRLYGVGLARFTENGKMGMDAFNEQAQGLFARHGMHLEAVLEIDHVVTPIGDTVEIKPERLVLFFLDQPSALAAYAADPEYTALAPLRDNGLASYDLFFGEDPAGANPSEISEMGL